MPDVFLDRFRLRHLPLLRPPFGYRPSRRHRRAVGHAVQPVAEQFRSPDRPRLADQNEEGSLEGILGVVGVAEDTAAAPEHHWAVPTPHPDKTAFVPLPPQT